jgi:SAM-dependent methyltransferase
MSSELYGGGDNLEVLTEAVRYNRFLVDAVVDASSGSDMAIDFGAGTGSLSVAARRKGLDVQCVEQDPALARRLREQNLTVYADLAEVVDGSQEFIYSLNVLEHIENDRNTLEALYSKLKPGGRLFLYVPAYGVLFSSMDRKVGHFRRYRKGGLTQIARDAGFVIERAEYADSLGFFVTLIYKMIGSRDGDLSPATVRFYDGFIFPFSRALDRLGLSRLFGKNLMAVMRRPHR